MNKCTAIFPKVFVHHVVSFLDDGQIVIYASDEQDGGNSFTLVYDFDDAEMVGNALVRLDDDVALLNMETYIVSYGARVLDEKNNVITHSDGKPLRVTKTRFRITKRIERNNLIYSKPSYWDEIYRVPWTPPENITM